MTPAQRQRLSELEAEMRAFTVYHADDVLRVQGWADTIGAILAEASPSEPQSPDTQTSET